jgi:uncharacterized membrane protein
LKLLEQFPASIIILIIVSVLIYLGLAQRVLDRMYLSDRGALLVIAAIIIGSFINLPVPFTPVNTTINVGGGLVPAGLAVYLLVKAGSTKEWIRALSATVATAVIVYALGSLVMRGSTAEPGGRFEYIDSLYLYPLVGGLTAYIFGRSRRAAFVAAVLGVLLVDVIQYVWLVNNRAPAAAVVSIGGAGILDTVILAGIVAVLLAEVIGEIRERLRGGPDVEGRPPELLRGLRKPELDQEGVEDDEKE